jgi:hypothetical protein
MCVIRRERIVMRKFVIAPLLAALSLSATPARVSPPKAAPNASVHHVARAESCVVMGVDYVFLGDDGWFSITWYDCNGVIFSVSRYLGKQVPIEIL